ncbi:MAG: PH domain-containing protein, partial [Bdellovibrionales bacterium]|nr:PH domain-containing protein [Bdellovibrionales bacterium]
MSSGAVMITRAWRSQLGRCIAFFGLSVVAVVLSSYFPGSVIKGELFTLFGWRISLSLPLFTLVPLYALMRLAWPIYDAVFMIDKRGIEMKTGILSLNQRIVRVRYEDIRSIELDQTLMERALNVGTVGIGSAA